MDGLLDYLRDYGSGVKQRFGLLADNPAEFTRQALLDVVPNRDEALAAQARLMGGQVDPQAYQSYMNKMQDIGGLLGSIRVYHGSPHKFDKFDLSKIGTGEGAQAYGHGLYVADNPNVAKTYADKLGDVVSYVDGKPVDFPMGSPQAMAIEYLKNSKSAQDAKDYAAYMRNAGMWKNNQKGYDDLLKYIDEFSGKSVDSRIEGNLYEANLRWPDAAREAADPMGPQHFLDWDKPLSQQPEAVRNVLSGFGVKSGETADEIAKRMISYGMSASDAMEYGAKNAYQNTGALAYAELGRDASASEKLRKAGIPGIRYLDAGSRGAGQGTANYVVFDDALIDILTRNGIPVKK